MQNLRSVQSIVTALLDVGLIRQQAAQQRLATAGHPHLMIMTSAQGKVFSVFTARLGSQHLTR
jgi:hypothetical protein